VYNFFYNWNTWLLHLWQQSNLFNKQLRLTVCSVVTYVLMLLEACFGHESKHRVSAVGTLDFRWSTVDPEVGSFLSTFRILLRSYRKINHNPLQGCTTYSRLPIRRCRSITSTCDYTLLHKLQQILSSNCDDVGPFVDPFLVQLCPDTLSLISCSDYYVLCR
jgi:hypothetical protein